MKNMYNYLKLLPILLLGCNWSATAQSTVINYTGASTTYTVPANTNTVFVTALGADGGNDFHKYSAGGNGAKVNCALAVTPGQILNVYVGGAGSAPAILFGGGAAGFNGGAAGLGNGGGSGGSSDIRYPGFAISDRVIVAGGGGGAGQDCSAAIGDFGEDGGPGGGLTGGDGNDAFSNVAFTGGTQTSGNALFAGAPAAGGFGIGGIGAGGGGYWGGYAGINILYPSTCGGGGGGGGGSSYTDPVTVSGVTHIRAGNGAPGTNPGQITICAPGFGGVITPAPICVGGTPGTFSDATGTPGGTWESSDPTIATIVPTTGVASGVAFGTVIITYHANSPCGNAIATVTVTVAAGANPITGFDTVCIGSSTTLSDGPSGTWTSQFPAIATVGAGTGIVTGKTMGTSTITYTIPGSCYSTFKMVVQDSVRTIMGPAYVCVNVDSITLTDATPGGYWTTGFTTIATVDSFTGVVKAHNPATGGSSTFIYYHVSGCVAQHFITANDTAYPITGANAICQGDATTLNEFAISGYWGTTNTSIASITPSAVVTGRAAGLDTISYNVNGCPSQLFPMTVNPTPAGITGITSICIGSAATVLTDTDPMGTWMSSDTTVATISPTGVVTTVSSVVGATTTITYTLPTTCFTTIVETVNSGPGPITGLTAVCQGDTTRLADVTAGGTWSSTALAIAQVVDSTGLVTGVLAGVVNISYTLPSGCFSVISPFTVQPPIPASISVARFPTTDPICPGTPIMYVATPVNGGIPTFTWYKFGVLQPSPLVDTFNYTPIHGDVIVVKLKTSGICSVSDIVFDTVNINVYMDAAPAITITELAMHDTLHYLGEVHTFFSTVVFGGTDATYQWYSNSAAGRVQIPGATNSTYATAVYSTDTFYCKVTGNAPCDFGSRTAVSNAIIIGDYLGIANTSNVTNALSLFPNPSSGMLTLSGSVNTAVSSNVTIEVSDMLGHVLYTKSTTAPNGSLHEQLILSDVANGSYLLHVISGSGSDVFHFVIDK
jgi:uncharacterized protein YjdB